MKTFIIIADPSCAGKTHIYVNCREDQFLEYFQRCGFGCRGCRRWQEVESMGIDDVDVFITEKGTIFYKDYWKIE